MAEQQAEEKATPSQAQQTQEEKFIPQSKVDEIVRERLARERAKYGDYDELKSFRDSHQRSVEEQQQKELEARKEYDKLKDTWSGKEKEYQSVLSQKDQEIRNMKVSNALTNQVMKLNAYPEAVNLIKDLVDVDKNGDVKIKGRDQNGMETLLNVEEGVKQFLEERKWLVKATGRSGAGTGAAGTSGEGSGTGTRNLATELQEAQRSGDRKRVMEIKQEIRNKHASQGFVSAL